MGELSAKTPQARLLIRWGDALQRADDQSAENAACDRATKFDQFYTIPAIALYCFARLLEFVEIGDCLFVEPSAGKGAFYDLLPSNRRLGIDLDPKILNVGKADFLKTLLPGDRPIIIVGNPPFGERAQLAVDFVNHAAWQAGIIAVIVPRTFKKSFVLEKLDPSLHLIHEEDITGRAFEFKGKPCAVPALFQIWVSAPVDRLLKRQPKKHADFTFGKSETAHLAFRRIGARAGVVSRDLGLNGNSHYFIKVTDPSRIDEVEAVLKRLRPRFAQAARNASGSPSLAKGEIVALYQEALDEQSTRRSADKL